MITSKEIHYQFDGNTLIIGTTDASEYYPFYSLFNSSNNGNPSTEIVDNIFLYYKHKNPIKVRHYYDINTYSQLFSSMKSDARISVFRFILDGRYYKIASSRGYLSDKDDNILLILCTNSRSVNAEGEIDTQNLKLFVSTEFQDNEIYKNIYKRVYREYIQYCYVNNIDVVFSTSEKIEEQVFNNNFELKFNNLTELKEHLNNEVKSIYSFDESVYQPSEEIEEGVS